MKSNIEQEFRGTINGVLFDDKQVFYTTEYLIQELESAKGISVDNENFTKELRNTIQTIAEKSDGSFDFADFEYNVTEALTPAQTLTDFSLPHWRAEAFNERIQNKEFDRLFFSQSSKKQTETKHLYEYLGKSSMDDLVKSVKNHEIDEIDKLCEKAEEYNRKYITLGNATELFEFIANNRDELTPSFDSVTIIFSDSKLNYVSHKTVKVAETFENLGKDIFDSRSVGMYLIANVNDDNCERNLKGISVIADHLPHTVHETVLIDPDNGEMYSSQQREYGYMSNFPLTEEKKIENTVAFSEKERNIIKDYHLDKIQGLSLTDAGERDAILFHLREGFRHLPYEEGYLITFDKDNKVNGTYCVSKGGINVTAANEHRILSGMKEDNVQTGWFIHNHPAGSYDPSPEDCFMANRLKQACSILAADKTIESMVVADKGIQNISTGKVYDCQKPMRQQQEKKVTVKR